MTFYCPKNAIVLNNYTGNMRMLCIRLRSHVSRQHWSPRQIRTYLISMPNTTFQTDSDLAFSHKPTIDH